MGDLVGGNLTCGFAPNRVCYWGVLIKPPQLVVTGYHWTNLETCRPSLGGAADNGCFVTEQWLAKQGGWCARNIQKRWRSWFGCSGCDEIMKLWCNRWATSSKLLNSKTKASNDNATISLQNNETSNLIRRYNNAAAERVYYITIALSLKQMKQKKASPIKIK